MCVRNRMSAMWKAILCHVWLQHSVPKDLRCHPFKNTWIAPLRVGSCCFSTSSFFARLLSENVLALVNEAGQNYWFLLQVTIQTLMSHTHVYVTKMKDVIVGVVLIAERQYFWTVLFVCCDSGLTQTYEGRHSGSIQAGAPTSHHHGDFASR